MKLPKILPDGTELTKLYFAFYPTQSAGLNGATVGGLLMDDLESVAILLHGLKNRQNEDDLTPQRYLVLEVERLKRVDSDAHEFVIEGQIVEESLELWGEEHGTISLRQFGR